MGGGVATTFRHSAVSLTPEVAASLEAAVQAALTEGAGLVEELDPQALYRTLEVWRGHKAVKLAVEYRGGHATVPAPAFREAWRLLKSQFGEGDHFSGQDEHP